MANRIYKVIPVKADSYGIFALAHATFVCLPRVQPQLVIQEVVLRVAHVTPKKEGVQKSPRGLDSIFRGNHRFIQTICDTIMTGR
jgi:hypothetical protein